MANAKHLDSFFYDSAKVLDRYDEAWGWYYNGSWYTSVPTVGAWGRAGGRAMKFESGYSGIRKGLIFGNQAEWAISMAWKFTQALGRHYLWWLEDGINSQLYAYVDPSGILKICTGAPVNMMANEVVVAESAGPVSGLNSFHHYDFVVGLDATTGVLKCKMDGGDTVIDESGLATITGANEYANAIIIGSEKVPNQFGAIDDIKYLADLMVRTGVSSFAGDGRILWRQATKAGAHTDWTPNPSAPNWDCVDEIPADDGDGVSSDTPGQVDTYGHAELPANVQSVGPIAVTVRAAKIESGPRKFATVLDIAATLNVGADLAPPLGDFRYFQQCWDGPFDPADANASEFGQKVTS